MSIFYLKISVKSSPLHSTPNRNLSTTFNYGRVQWMVWQNITPIIKETRSVPSSERATNKRILLDCSINTRQPYHANCNETKVSQESIWSKWQNGKPKNVESKQMNDLRKLNTIVI